MEILSWNIQAGGGSRADRIAQAVIAKAPDVAVLSEFRNNDAGLLIRTRLLMAGYLHQVTTGAEGRINSVLIASRLPGNGALYPGREQDFPHAVSSLEVAWPTLAEPLRVIGVYLPHKKKHRWFDVLLELLAEDRPTVLVGDYNTGVNHIDQAGNSFWYSEALTAMEELGCRDAFRVLHPDAREFSWFSHQGNGFRYDHSWVTSGLVSCIQRCEFSHREREARLSDHSPMVLELGEGS